MKFGEKLKFYRELTGISQNKLAQLSNVPAPNIRKYERGARYPKANALHAIADALKISPNTFLEVEHETIGDIASLFFLLAKYADIEVHGKEVDGKYSANNVSFSFSDPLLQEFLADWASTTESIREMRKKAKEFKEEEIKKPMLDSAEKLECTLEYKIVGNNDRI